MSAPWRIGELVLGRFSIIAAAVMVILMAAIAGNPSWRQSVRAWIERTDFSPSPRTVLAGSLFLFLFLFKVVLSTWFALEINAWDFSLYYDLPLERTLHGHFLYSEFLGASTISNHAGFILLVFLPLYAVLSTPYWLLAATALAIAAAAAVGFHLFRILSGDPFVAALLSFSLVMNPYTVRTVRYGFHPEIFYPLAVFLLLFALLRRRPGLYALGLIMTVAIKEDAIVVLTGVALVALCRWQWRWAATAFVSGVTIYVVDVLVIMPFFGAAPNGRLWYLGYWGSLGSTPTEVIYGALSDPLRILLKLFESGVFELLLSLLFLPVLAPSWFLGALPALILYGIADFERLSHFTLYYSMPILPFLYAGLPDALKRLSRLARRPPVHGEDHRVRFRLRIAALVLSVWSALLASHSFKEARPAAPEVLATVRRLPSASKVVVQGSLLPHAGYGKNLRVLDRRSLEADAYLLHLDANPYPLSKEELLSLAHHLRQDQRYRFRESANGLLLFKRLP